MPEVPALALLLAVLLKPLRLREFTIGELEVRVWERV